MYKIFALRRAGQGAKVNRKIVNKERNADPAHEITHSAAVEVLKATAVNSLGGGGRRKMPLL